MIWFTFPKRSHWPRNHRPHPRALAVLEAKKHDLKSTNLGNYDHGLQSPQYLTSVTRGAFGHFAENPGHSRHYRVWKKETGVWGSRNVSSSREIKHTQPSSKSPDGVVREELTHSLPRGSSQHQGATAHS